MCLAFAAGKSFVGRWTLAIVTTNGTTAPAVPIDGKEQPTPANVPGPAGSTDHVSTLNGETIYTEFKKNGKVVATRNVSLHRDGKTMTSIIEGTLRRNAPD